MPANLLIRKTTAGLVEIYDQPNNAAIIFLPPQVAIQPQPQPEQNTIKIAFENGQYDLLVSAVSHTQKPSDATPQPFAGTIADLCNLLANSFFVSSNNADVLEVIKTAATSIDAKTPASSTKTTTYKISANNNNAQNLKVGAATVSHIALQATPAVIGTVSYFLCIYDKSSAPNPTTDTALLKGKFAVVSGGSTSMPVSISVTNGLAIAIVANAANNDNTSVPANTIIAQITHTT